MSSSEIELLLFESAVLERPLEIPAGNAGEELAGRAGLSTAEASDVDRGAMELAESIVIINEEAISGSPRCGHPRRVFEYPRRRYRPHRRAVALVRRRRRGAQLHARSEPPFHRFVAAQQAYQGSRGDDRAPVVRARHAARPAHTGRRAHAAPGARHPREGRLARAGRPRRRGPCGARVAIRGPGSACTPTIAPPHSSACAGSHRIASSRWSRE